MKFFGKSKKKNKENEKKKNKLNFDKTLFFCKCGNVTDLIIDLNCNICLSPKKDMTPFSPTELNEIVHNKIVIPLSEKFNQDFEKISLKDYFNLDETQENHLIYRLVRGSVFKEFEGDIFDFFNEMLKETKNDDKISLIAKTIETDVINDFYEKGFKYTGSVPTTPSKFITVEKPILKNKHGAGTKILATALAGPIGFAATSGIEQTTERKNEYVPSEYADYEYLFTPEYIQLKFGKSSNPIDFNNNKIIVKWEDIDLIDDDNSLILKNGDIIPVYPPRFSNEINKYILDVLGTLDWEKNSILRTRNFDESTEKALLLVNKLLNQYSKKVKNDNIKSNKINENSSDSLENLVKMYEKGLLTDEEFLSLKKKLIE